MTFRLEATMRLARDSDAAAIRDLTQEAYAKWPDIIGMTPLPMRVDYDAAVRVHRFDLLEMDGRLVALIETVRERDELLIVNVAVKPSMQKRGLGLKLLAHAEALAAAQGLRGTRLYTNKMMADNIALYERIGYIIEREEEISSGRIRVHMAKARTSR